MLQVAAAIFFSLAGTAALGVIWQGLAEHGDAIRHAIGWQPRPRQRTSFAGSAGNGPQRAPRRSIRVSGVRPVRQVSARPLLLAAA